ncbi:MAG: sulfite exporter TauE/SafE family protein [Clostridiaceae bacterium]|nr:sulfite exporter TauE/SafE family protein [Clostridiaceae bacterium]
MDFFNSFDFSSFQWLLIIITAFIIGLARIGVTGIVMLVIPILASEFGGKESTGIILPLLILGDIFAVTYYRKHADWSIIKKLLPWTLAGVALGAVVGNYINDSQFKTLIAIIVIICLAILLFIERKGNKANIPESQLLSALAGIGTGFSSMIGNAAGPIFSVFLLSKGFKKFDFMGTSAWFFLIINQIKIPLHVFVWHNISVKSFLTAGLMLPAIALGAFVGAVIIKKLNERFFHYFVIVLTAISAIRLLF